MKRIIMLIIFLMSFQTVYAQNDITVTINSVPVIFDVQPRIINSRTMVPVRAIFESLGASVLWDSETRTVTAQNGARKVSMTIGRNEINIGEEVVVMDTVPMIINNRTFIPARFAAEAFDSSVEWDGENKTVQIITGKKQDMQYFKRYYNGIYSILYPADWYLDETYPEMIFIYNQGDIYEEHGMGMISVSHMEFMNASFSDTVSARYDYLIGDCGYNITKFENTKVNGCDAAIFKYIDQDGDFVTSYLICGNANAYFIEFFTDKDGAFKDIYDIVLSSFMLF